MPYPYITGDEVRLRLGLRQTDRLFDDDEDGGSDAEVLNQLAQDASARVAAALRATRRYKLSAIAENTPAEVKRLALDVAHVYAARRHPEVMRMNWVELNEAVERELKRLVDGDMMIDADELPYGEPPTPAPGGRAHMSSDAERGW